MTTKSGNKERFRTIQIHEKRNLSATHLFAVDPELKEDSYSYLYEDTVWGIAGHQILVPTARVHTTGAGFEYPVFDSGLTIYDASSEWRGHYRPCVFPKTRDLSGFVKTIYPVGNEAYASSGKYLYWCSTGSASDNPGCVFDEVSTLPENWRIVCAVENNYLLVAQVDPLSSEKRLVLYQHGTPRWSHFVNTFYPQVQSSNKELWVYSGSEFKVYETDTGKFLKEFGLPEYLPALNCTFSLLQPSGNFLLSWFEGNTAQNLRLNFIWSGVSALSTAIAELTFPLRDVISTETLAKCDLGCAAELNCAVVRYDAASAVASLLVSCASEDLGILGAWGIIKLNLNHPEKAVYLQGSSASGALQHRVIENRLFVRQGDSTALAVDEF